jgi:hypothetical protein
MIYRSPSRRKHLTHHWSEPLAALLSRCDIMEVFSMLMTLAVAMGRSVLVR